MALFGGVFTNALNSVVGGVTALAQNALPNISTAVSGTLTSLAPIVKDVVNSTAANIGAATLGTIAGGGGLSGDSLNALVTSGKPATATYATPNTGDGYTVGLTGFKKLINFYKLDEGGCYLLNAEGARSLNWIKVAGVSLAGVGIFYMVAKKMRWIR